MQLTDRRGYLELVAKRREQNQRSKVGTGDTLSEETIFEENVALELDGFAYHPNLLEFSFAGLFGLLQHEYREDLPRGQRGGSDTGDLREFDLRANMLQKKKYPGTVYLRRSEALVPRAFRSSVLTTTENYGLSWQYLSEKVPTQFQFDYADLRLDPLETVEKQGRQQNTTTRFETGYNFSDRNQLELIYEHQRVSEEPFLVNYASDEVTLAHRLEFGRNYRQRLDSELNYYDQRDTVDFKRMRWRENLWLQHTDTLRSRFQVELRDRAYGGRAGLPPIEERSYRFFGMLEHRLYDSLVSEVHGFAQTQEFESGAEVDRQGIALGFDYRKKNPWGTLQSNYRAEVEQEDRRGGAFRSEVIDEQHSFRDPDPVVLSNPNIETGSIVITAQDGFTTYEVGRDYTVRTVGEQVEIERVVTGRIADGETVLIDYIFSLGGSFTIDSIRQSFLLRQNFSFGLSPYYRLRWQDENISPRTATGALAEDITAHVFGVEYRWRSLRLMTEYEDHGSTINPFTALRFSAAYSHRFKFGATAGMRMNWSSVSYSLPESRDTAYLTWQGSYRHPLTRRVTFEGAVTYRNRDDTLTGIDEGIDVDLSLEWLIRETEIEITYEFGQFEDEFARNDHSTFFLRLRRRF